MYVEDSKQFAVIESAVAAGKRVSLDVKAIGPAQAVRRMSEQFPTENDRRVWEFEARVRAIVGSCPRSLESAHSGMRCWLAYYRKGLKKCGEAFPPALDDLLSFSCLFRHPGTFCNYLGYIRLACELLGVATEVFNHPSVKRAKTAIAKRRLFIPREPMFIMQARVQQLVQMGAGSDGRRVWSYLYLLAYVFLLRLPSEALPMAAHALPSGSVAVPVLTVGDAEVSVWFSRRKNRLHPSTMKRKCWCRSCKATCPVHVVGGFFAGLEKGAQPFAAFSAGDSLRESRAMCLRCAPQVRRCGSYVQC